MKALARLFFLFVIKPNHKYDNLPCGVRFLTFFIPMVVVLFGGSFWGLIVFGDPAIGQLFTLIPLLIAMSWRASYFCFNRLFKDFS